jgi:hypothetical protein
MEPSDVIWSSVLVLGAVVETWALRNGRPGDTLSERIRKWFRVDTMTGKAVFTVAWVGFSAWMLFHVVG